jgi:hypothetical protein
MSKPFCARLLITAPSALWVKLIPSFALELGLVTVTTI